MVMVNPLVSVILCTYNGEKYIAETIESVLNQTYKNLELIVWNDGSTDSTEQIVKSYADNRIRYFYNKNSGIGFSLSLACKEVKGKYISRIDDDDICMPNRIEKQVGYMESHPDCVLLSSSAYYIDENGKILNRCLMCTWNRVIKKTLKVGSATISPASLFRTDAYFKTCGFLPVKCAEDRILWSKMQKYGKFHNLSDALIKYRLRGSSLSHIINKNPYSNVLEEVCRKIVMSDKVLEDDIDLYNKVYLMAKNCNIQSSTSLVYTPKIEERIYKYIRPLLGDRATSKVLLFIKNIYCYITK